MVVRMAAASMALALVMALVSQPQGAVAFAPTLALRGRMFLSDQRCIAARCSRVQMKMGMGFDTGICQNRCAKKLTNTHKHGHTHMHAHTHTHACTHTCSHTHAHTNTHTQEIAAARAVAACLEACRACPQVWRKFSRILRLSQPWKTQRSGRPWRR